jgi:hypothetical protein
MFPDESEGKIEPTQDSIQIKLTLSLAQVPATLSWSSGLRAAEEKMNLSESIQHFASDSEGKELMEKVVYLYQFDHLILHKN